MRLVTHQDFAELVRAHGVEFWPVAGSVQDIAQGQDMRERLEGGSFVSVMAQMAKEAQSAAVAAATGGLAACRGMDLLVAGIGGVFIGIALAEKPGLPLVQAYYIPFTPTAALSAAGQRGILLRGWGGIATADSPETILTIDSAPFTWLFPRCAAVVHHGGAGTTAAGLRAGVPSVVIPFFGDQPFWGRRVAELGVGTKPISRQKLTAAGLAEAIVRAATDADMRQRSSNLGARIRGEDGVVHAVRIIAESIVVGAR